MPGQVPAHKAIAIAAVLLLHLVLVWLFLRATIVTLAPPHVLREEPITVWLRPAEKPKPPQPEEEKKKEGPPLIERAIGPPIPAPSGAPPATEYNGLRALGRYLNNCSNADYEALSGRELAHCLGNRWQTLGEGPVGLGLESPSEWKAQLDKKKAPAKPFEHECPQGTLNSNLGLPCYDFGN